MKKKTCAVCAVCAAVILILIYCFPVYRLALLDVREYYDSNELGMLMYIGSCDDREEAKDIIKTADAAFADISHTREENLLAYGALDRYAIDSARGVDREKHELKLLSAHLDDGQGCMWVMYSNEAYDVEGSMICGSANIYSLWYLEKNDAGKWTVVNIKEQP